MLFAAIASVASSLIGQSLEGIWLFPAGIFLAIVPAAIWLVAFNPLDQTEPEPKRLVVGVFVLGLLLAAAIGQPIIRDLFQVQDWLDTSPGHGNCRLGPHYWLRVQEYLKYAVIRYTVFYEPEFDERIDGLIFGAAVGLGYATFLNLRFVLDHTGVNLGVGAVTISVVALAHASFSGVMGYFVGRARFEKMGALLAAPLGLIVAATSTKISDLRSRSSSFLSRRRFLLHPVV